jgi:hypothetical protein
MWKNHYFTFIGESNFLGRKAPSQRRNEAEGGKLKTPLDLALFPQRNVKIKRFSDPTLGANLYVKFVSSVGSTT